MRESRPYGSVRGDRGNSVPYRDQITPRVARAFEPYPRTDLSSTDVRW